MSWKLTRELEKNYPFWLAGLFTGTRIGYSREPVTHNHAVTLTRKFPTALPPRRTVPCKQRSHILTTYASCVVRRENCFYFPFGGFCLQLSWLDFIHNIYNSKFYWSFHSLCEILDGTRSKNAWVVQISRITYIFIMNMNHRHTQSFSLT